MSQTTRELVVALSQRFPARLQLAKHETPHGGIDDRFQTRRIALFKLFERLPCTLDTLLRPRYPDAQLAQRTVPELPEPLNALILLRRVLFENVLDRTLDFARQVLRGIKGKPRAPRKNPDTAN